MTPTRYRHLHCDLQSHTITPTVDPHPSPVILSHTYDAIGVWESRACPVCLGTGTGPGAQTRLVYQCWDCSGTGIGDWVLVDFVT